MRRLLFLLVLTGCQGWVPFFWGSTGKNEGFTESQWANTEADVGDLERWEVGIGFAYGGWLPGLVESRFPPVPLRHPDEHEHPIVTDDFEGEVEALGKWPWFAWASLACLGIGALAFIVWWRKRRNNGKG